MSMCEVKQEAGGQEYYNILCSPAQLLDKGYTRQPTNLLSTYRKQWAEWDVLRELLSNSYDATKCWVKLKGDSEKTIVSDDGNGLTLGQLIYLGANENKGIEAIGKFGEGLKVSLAVTVRKGYKVSIRSKDYVAVVEAEEPLFKVESGAKSIVFYVLEGLEECKGTTITIYGLPLETSESLIKDKFLIDYEDSVICEGGTTTILSGKYKGKLFCKGVYVQDLVNANYGYDIKKLTLNTDRQASNSADTLKYIAYDLDAIQDKEKIKDYFEQLVSNQGCLERQATTIYLNSKIKETFEEMHLGLPIYDSKLEGELRHYGKRPLLLPEAWVCVMENNGIVTGSKYLQLQAEASRRANRKEYHDLSLNKREALDKAIDIIDSIPLFDTKILDEIRHLRFYEPSPNINNSAYYDPLDSTVNIRNEESLFRINTLAQLLTHEFIHKFEGYKDATAEFQHSLDSKIEKLFEYVLDKSKHLANFEQKLMDNNGQITVTVPPKFKSKLELNRYYKVKVSPLGSD